jgi:hypothetical protein
MNIQQGNILDVSDGVIVNQVDYKGLMVAGLALQIRNKWPDVYTRCQSFCKSGYSEHSPVQLVNVGHRLYIANVFARDIFDRTDEGTLRKVLSALGGNYAGDIHIPCGMDFGNWDTTRKIIADVIPNAIIWKPL